MASNKYEIIILGAGIAGLLLASELSKQHKVLIIDNNSEIPKDKYWLTSERSALVNSELTSLIDSYIPHMDFLAYDDTVCRVTGRFPLWDGDRLLNYFVENIKSNGGEFKFGLRFYSLKYTNQKVCINVGNKSLTAKLIIDCMGYNSPIAAALTRNRITGYYFLYGRRLRMVRKFHPIALQNVIMERNPAYLEVFPTESGLAHAAIILPINSLEQTRNIKSDFDFIIKNSYLRDYVQFPSESTLSYGGIIPVGLPYKNSLDNIFFFGEAALLNPAASGTCLTRMLYHYKKTSEALSHLVKTNSLRKRDFKNSSIEYLSNFNLKLQLLVYKDILSWNSEQFKKFVDRLSRVENDTIADLIFGDFNPQLLLKSKYLRTMVQSRNLLLPYYTIKTILSIL